MEFGRYSRSATSFEPVCDQLRTSFEPDSVMEFGLYCVFKIVLITFRLSRRRREMYCGHPRLCVCVPVRGRMPTLFHGPGWILGEWYGMPPSCALLGGLAICVRVALIWQHNANPSYKLASTLRYDDIMRTRNVSECSVLALCLVYDCNYCRS